MTATLIVGCGDLGRRIAEKLLRQDASVSGLVRSDESARQLAHAGITPCIADLDSAIAPVDIDAKHLLYLAPPPPQGSVDTRMQNFLDAASGTPKSLIYLSTTGVYGDCQGAWIDETAAVAPKAERAKRRLDAEQQVRQKAAREGWPHIIIRVAGIYGPNRLPLKRLQNQEPLLCADQAPFTNRIHVDDLASIILALREKGRDGETYNVTDGKPGNMTDYFLRVADFAGLPHPPTISMTEAQHVLSKGLLSYLQESRRLSNAKLMADLDLELEYPTLDDGLAAIFNRSPEDLQ